ncbi:hypothetical protein GEMRC1_006236 [Eukaryota sp. GEM-RC1]
MTEEFDIPKAQITRIIKSVLPEGSSVAKDASLAINHATTTFISYITDIATRSVAKARRSTILPEDIINALQEADFLDFATKSSQYLSELKQKKKASQPPPKPSDPVDDEVEVIEDVA